eukprot:SAG25_NODE_11823_length_294_cov_0.794872_1_plen_52_part_01
MRLFAVQCEMFDSGDCLHHYCRPENYTSGCESPGLAGAWLVNRLASVKVVWI